MIKLPNLSLVVLIGPSGAGKSTFARRHFRATEIVSSDFCRGLVSDDENNQAASNDAFDLLHYIVAKRLERGLLTVVDATNVQPEARQPLVQLARKYHCLPVAVVLNQSESICRDRNRSRADRNFGPHVIRNQHRQMRSSLRVLKREGFRQIVELQGPDEIDAACIQRVPMWNDRRDLHGPFDLIGDVHGCGDELEALLSTLGYASGVEMTEGPLGGPVWQHPQGRQAVFVGDLVDRGPRVLDVLKLVRNMVSAGTGLCVPGNHDSKLLRWLNGRQVTINHGLEQTIAEFEALPQDEPARSEYRKEMAKFLESLISHYVLDDGRLVVAHAGMKESMQGRGSGRVRDFALYGETTGETDEFGLPIRYNWAAEYRGTALVVYGHTPVPEPEWLNGTINIDTGCVFGGQLTALRYPERTLVSVPAQQQYCVPRRPFLADAATSPGLTSQQQLDHLLDAEDVLGKRIIHTPLVPSITIRQENATAALEVMSRFAANPQWLIYLPPTMSPCATSTEPGFLEHPAEAFSYFRDLGVPRVVCEEKHMGSRAVVIVCRDGESARRRFGVQEEESGIIYTRTGRRFFDDSELESAILGRLRAAISAAGYWDQFQTDWFCLDCELLPWSAKAQELLRSQYAAVGAAGRSALPAALAQLEAASSRGSIREREQLDLLHSRLCDRAENLNRFTQAYRQYCWTVQKLDDLKLAPFHILASEGRVHSDQGHLWHMRTLAEICQQDPGILLATRDHTVDLADAADEERVTQWWKDFTAQGGEGMVVKPEDFIARNDREFVQPAVKCRGPEYLRIIYGPDYLQPENLSRLRNRSLGRKRALAAREFALGLEALNRFICKEPLRKVHECVFGVLALESEPVDPRL